MSIVHKDLLPEAIFLSLLLHRECEIVAALKHYDSTKMEGVRDYDKNFWTFQDVSEKHKNISLQQTLWTLTASGYRISEVFVVHRKNNKDYPYQVCVIISQCKNPAKDADSVSLFIQNHIFGACKIYMVEGGVLLRMVDAQERHAFCGPVDRKPLRFKTGKYRAHVLIKVPLKKPFKKAPTKEQRESGWCALLQDRE